MVGYHRDLSAIQGGDMTKELEKLLKELSWAIFSNENFAVEFCLERTQEKMREINMYVERSKQCPSQIT